jgi:hypothetical protein
MDLIWLKPRSNVIVFLGKSFGTSDIPVRLQKTVVLLSWQTHGDGQLKAKIISKRNSTGIIYCSFINILQIQIDRFTPANKE